LFRFVLFLHFTAHFRAEGVGAVMYVTEWFTTMFVYSLPRQTCAAVWDLFFIGDGAAALFRCSIGILALLEEELLSHPMEGIITTLKKQTKRLAVTALMLRQREIVLTRATKLLLQEQVTVKWIEDRGIKTLVCMVADADNMFSQRETY
jgi:Rab-GTPase-TBC domain